MNSHNHNLFCSTRWLGIVIAGLTVLFAAGGASATCGTRAGTGATAAPNMLALTNLAALQPAPNGSIVGLWHVTYTAGGQVFYEAFDMWHSDGTEVETANLSPIEGNFCMGVWKQVGSSIHLSHVGWGFDNNGNPVGMFTITERNALGGNGNFYKGTFDYKAYDLNGNLLQEISGMLAATRIGVN